MCGIAGVLHKQMTSEPAPIGRSLLTMAACLQHRGMDSAGMAVFGGSDMGLRLQVMLPHSGPLPEPQEILKLGGGRLSDLCPEKSGFSAAVRPASGNSVQADLELIQALESGLPGSTVSGMGSRMTVEKAVGMVEGLEVSVGSLMGTHGIAHLRQRSRRSTRPTPSPSGDDLTQTLR
jgi:glutamate synthase domain-containing protein 1